MAEQSIETKKERAWTKGAVSYNLRIILSIIDDTIEEYPVNVTMSPTMPILQSFLAGVVPAGVKIAFDDTKWTISILTEDCGEAFCESALIESDKGLVCTRELGYDEDPRRYPRPDDLRSHLRVLFKRLPTWNPPQQKGSLKAKYIAMMSDITAQDSIEDEQ